MFIGTNKCLNILFVVSLFIIVNIFDTAEAIVDSCEGVSDGTTVS